MCMFKGLFVVVVGVDVVVVFVVVVDIVDRDWCGEDEVLKKDVVFYL